MGNQKGFAPILIIILIAIGILFLPIPYYENEDRWCESDPPQLCATKGWHLGPSLWKRVSGDLQKTDSSTIQPSPAPTTDKDAEGGKACGGFAGETGQFACPEGYKCEYPKPSYPDAQGKCVKD